VAPWVGRFFGDLQQAQSARFYRAVGQLGEQFIEIEKQYLSI
jgi:TorA maturation chaperone TorD